MIKKEKEPEFAENELYLKAKKELENAKESSGKKSREEIYLQLKSCFISYINGMIKEKSFLTEQETVQSLKKFNIGRSAIEMADSLIKSFMQIEYNNHEYSGEELFRMIIDADMAIDEISIQRKAYHRALKDNIQSQAKEKVVREFESSLLSLKDYYLKKGELQSEIIIALLEYYNYLPDEKKFYYSRDYYYYCKSLPGIMNIISSLKSAKDEFERRQLSAAVSRLFAKLDDQEKEAVYPKILTIFTSHEQKIDFLLIFGYSQITAKNTKNALLIYKELFHNFEMLDSQKKKYYQPIIMRYMNSIKSLQNKK
jgi:hypothetical protein